MPNSLKSALACGAFTGILIGSGLPSAWAASGQIDLDPLRRFLPRSDIFMQVPGAMLAVKEEGSTEDSIEERSKNRHGGLVVGYCLKASCSHVTHLVVLQVCESRVGGLTGRNELVLGVVKLPYGDTPGRLLSLQGRNYAENFHVYGPVSQALGREYEGTDSSLYSLWADGVGPVAPLEYLGLEVKPKQSQKTIALQFSIVQDQRSDWHFPRLEVRHLCERPMS